MFRIFAGGLVLSVVVAACSSVSESPSQNVDGFNIFWKDFGKISSVHPGSLELNAGEGIYMFGRTSAPTYTLSNGDVIVHNYNSCDKYTGDPSGLYAECWNKGVRAENAASSRLSFAKFVEVAEVAVRREGSCQWVGYDRAFDLQARSIGSAASSKDERLFFAKLRCG